MSVTKLKPVRTPRLLDEWAQEKEVTRQEAARNSKVAIEHSKKLLAQSKEIMDRMGRRAKNNARRKAG